MRKKKTYMGLIILLCFIEIAFGIVVAHQYLIKAISNKRILFPIEYVTTLKVIEENVEKIDDAVNNIAEERQQDPEKSTVDYSNVTLEVTHDLSDVNGSKIEIVSAESSSVIAQSGHTNTAYQAYDGDLSTSWQEGVDGPGLGSWLYYKFDGSHFISDIVFYLGIWRETDGKDYYHDNYRPKEIQISAGDLRWDISFEDDKQPQVVHFSEPIPAEDISLTILDVYNTNRYEDMGIAEIVAYE